MSRNSVIYISVILFLVSLIILACYTPEPKSGPEAAKEQFSAPKEGYEDFVQFSNVRYNYGLMYPKDWEYLRFSPCRVIFITNLDEPYTNAHVSVEVISYLNMGMECTDCETVCQILTDIFNSMGGRTYDIEDCACLCDGTDLQGVELKGDYVIDDNQFKEWIAILPYDDENFMQFTYSAPVEQYTAFLQKARLIRDSWDTLES